MSAAERAAQERLAQGLPEHVEDEHLLDQVAEVLAGVDQADGAGPAAGTRRRRRTELITPPIGPAAQPEKRSDGS